MADVLVENIIRGLTYHTLLIKHWDIDVAGTAICYLLEESKLQIYWTEKKDYEGYNFLI